MTAIIVYLIVSFITALFLAYVDNDTLNELGVIEIIIILILGFPATFIIGFLVLMYVIGVVVLSRFYQRVKKWLLL